MKVKRNLVLLLLAGITAFSAQAQEIWSLDRCIEYAIENNIQYKRQKLQAETTGNLSFNSKMKMLPSAGAFASASQNWGTTFSYDQLEYVNQNNLDGYFGLGVDMDIFRGFSKINEINQYKYSLLSDMQDVEKMKNSITFEIVAAYLQILLNEELLKLAESQLEVTRQQVERTTRLVEVGNEPMGRLLEIQAQEALENSNRTSAKNDLDLAYLRLSQLLFLSSAEDLQIEVPSDLEADDANVLKQPQEVYQDALGFLPDIKAAEYFLKSEEKRLARISGARYPNITARFVDYTRFNELAVHPSLYDSDPANDQVKYAYLDQVKDFRYRAITLNLNIPIFSNWNTQTMISNARVSLDDAQLALDQAELDLYMSIQQAHANAVAAMENYRSSLEAVKSQQEAFDYSEQMFEVGMVSSVDYNIAKNLLTSAQSNLLQSKYQYIFRSMLLDFYSGNPIAL